MASRGIVRHYNSECNCENNMLTDCGCVAHVYTNGQVDMTWCDTHSGDAALHAATTRLLRAMRSEDAEVAEIDSAIAQVDAAIDGQSVPSIDPATDRAIAALSEILDLEPLKMAAAGSPSIFAALKEGQEALAALANQAPDPPNTLLLSTLKLARSALTATMHAGAGYDWNADPRYITLRQGEAVRAIEVALALVGVRAGETTT